MMMMMMMTMMTMVVMMMMRMWMWMTRRGHTAVKKDDKGCPRSFANNSQEQNN